MIVCICQNVNDKTVEQYKQEGKTLKDLASDYNICSGCRKCLSHFKETFSKD